MANRLAAAPVRTVFWLVIGVLGSQVYNRSMFLQDSDKSRHLDQIDHCATYSAIYPALQVVTHDARALSWRHLMCGL
jgi:hypothetical protein